MKLSANLGFLFPDLALPDRILSAQKAGFDAVELHWPYDTPVAEVGAALLQTRLPLLCLNTDRGNVKIGENGLSALAGREGEAQKAIDTAFAYGSQLGARSVHVMSGRIQDGANWDVLATNLVYAADLAGRLSMTVLIEPLNPHDAPGYLLADLDGAIDLLRKLDHPAIKLMFDCYHISRMGLDPVAAYSRIGHLVGHVQFAAVPDRAEPDHGDMKVEAVLEGLEGAGYEGYFGAEYRPRTGSFDWMTALKS